MVDTKTLPSSRVTEAREVAQALLDELELGTSPIINSIMKGNRLARLLRDTDAATWLDLEARGYPLGFVFSVLGSCEKYARAGGRILPDNNYYPPSLPQYEAAVRTSEKALDGIRFPANLAPSVSSSNPHEWTGIQIAGAVDKVTTAYTAALRDAQLRCDHNVKLFNGMKSAVHSYATDCYHALSFGQTAEGLFERARSDVDRFIRDVAPKSAEQLVAAFERYDSGGAEALSHALTSVRRLLSTVADAVYPPKSEPIADGSGRKHDVGQQEYKNRLLAFIQERQTSQSARAILGAELEHLAARLDAVYEKSCKGVHGDVTEAEARLVLIGSYMFLAEIARLASGEQNAERPEQMASEPAAMSGGQRAEPDDGLPNG
jgi:hypothetical protein